MKVHLKYIILLVVMLQAKGLFAQERDSDTIDGGTVTVIKPYTPKIADAFKIKEVPILNDSTIIKKKKITYNIFSIPVASTFTPAKGKAATLDKEKSMKRYDNYASLGGGSYLTILGEVYLNHTINRTEQVGGYFSHHSSAGNIEGVNFDTNFSETGVSAYYKKQQREVYWEVNGGVNLQYFNWYGLPNQELATFDVGHSFYTAHINGNVKFENSIFENASVLFRRFGDDQDSGENRIVLETEFAVPLVDEMLQTTVTFDYLGGAFKKSYFDNDNLNYSNIAIGIKPSYPLNIEGLTLDLGVNVVYFNDIETTSSKFFIYPNISASYPLVDDLLIAYGTVKGGLQQNSYYSFAQENSFVSPTLIVLPTDQAYKALAGIKGKLSNSISYNVFAHYSADNNRAFFTSNVALISAPEKYQFANSFGITYDDLKTFALEGALHVDVSRNFELGFEAGYYSYSTEKEDEAWNLPNITASAFLDVQIDEHWFAGANLFFIGNRKDSVLEAEEALLLSTATQVTLKSYFDANAHIGYKVTERLSAFAKVNNIANQNYNRWVNYPVQGFQFLAGATYQFDLY